MKNEKQRGIRSFKKRDFKSALTHFSLALQHKPNDKQLYVYIDLTHLAFVREEEAISLFEFYQASLKSKLILSSNLENIVDSLQNGLEKLHNIFDEKNNAIAFENGIEYNDFLNLIETRGSFSSAFEDIMFSTKVIISNKDDFLHFLNLLIENNFLEMAFNYLENAIMMFPQDGTLRSLAIKIGQKYDNSIK